MMKKIIDWLLGSFFRTLGKVLAIAIIGYLLIILALKANIKLPFMKISALQIYRGGSTLYNFPDLPEDVTKFFIYKTIENDKNIIHMVGWNESNYVFYPKLTTCNGPKSYYQMKSEENDEAIVHVKKYDLIDNEWVYNSYITGGSVALDSNNYIFTNTSKGFVGKDNMIDTNCKSYPAITLYDQHKITIHTDGGIIYDSFFQNEEVSYIDTATYYYANATLSTLLNNISFYKFGYTQAGLYYDANYKTEVNKNDSVDKDLDIYVKWESTELAGTIENIVFNTYEFNKNYEYGIINVGANKGEKVYLAFKERFDNFELYTYNKANNTTSSSAVLCLVSIGRIGDWYYYEYDTNNVGLNEVVILYKSKLEKDGISYLNFKLSDNAKMTYSNNAKKIPIIDESGNKIIVDFEEAILNSQSALIRQNSNILDIFTDLFKNKNNNIFTLFSNVWDKLKTSNLYPYLISLLVGAIIIVVIRSASRT